MNGAKVCVSIIPLLIITIKIERTTVIFCNRAVNMIANANELSELDERKCIIEFDFSSEFDTNITPFASKPCRTIKA